MSIGDALLLGLLISWGCVFVYFGVATYNQHCYLKAMARHTPPTGSSSEP